MGWSRSKPEHPADKVILYQFFRAHHAPSSSPFCLKLELYLRLAKIDYENELGHQMSSKGKMPWIMYNGQEVADSQLCIEVINKEYNVDLNQDLTTEQCAVSRALLKMTEENLMWFTFLYRFWYGDRAWLLNVLFANAPVIKHVFVPWIGRQIYNRAWGHGIGRHSYDELVAIMQKDMKALSDYLGEKDYFMGSEPAEIDCALFGNLASVKFNESSLNPQRIYMLEHCENLSKYCDRIKERFWPDWDELCVSTEKREIRG